MHIKGVLTILNLVSAECLHKIAIKSLFCTMFAFLMLHFDCLARNIHFWHCGNFFEIFGTVPNYTLGLTNCQTSQRSLS